MDDIEITCIVKDRDGIISHCGIKGYGVQNVGLMEKLIMEEACSFFIYDGDKKKRNIFARTSPDGTSYLTTDLSGSDLNELSLLPLFDRPFVRQLIESVR